MSIQSQAPASTRIIPALSQAATSESLARGAARRLFHNRAAVLGLAIVCILILMALFAPFVAPYDYSQQVLVDNNKVPPWMLTVFPGMRDYARLSTDYPLGADYVGRDLFSRIVYGARVSLTVAFIASSLGLMIGIAFGSLSGYVGGRLDNFMMRFVDVMYCFPDVLFVILLMAFFRGSLSEPQPGSVRYAASTLDAALGGMLFVLVGIGLTAWRGVARLARGQVLSVRQMEYVEAARAIGSKDRRIILHHVLPNILGPLIVVESMAIPQFVALEALLSFIGLGVTPPTPSWGRMIAEGAEVLRTYPNQALFPALALAITMFAFNFLGDGLRDALDPRMRGA